MKIKITQYGYKNDECADSLTEAGIGAWDNKLEPCVSCALTRSAQNLLDASPASWLRIDFGNGRVTARRFDDRAPEDDPRVDIYAPGGFDKTQPDYAEVTLLKQWLPGDPL